MDDEVVLSSDHFYIGGFPFDWGGCSRHDKVGCRRCCCCYCGLERIYPKIDVVMMCGL